MPSFAQDIRPLFRPDDVEAMEFAFDLRDYQNVKAHAPGIYERLADGSMPCDGPWSAEQIALFRRWMDEGHDP
jgi:hypothetical protein